jgi:hypothetical protein
MSIKNYTLESEKYVFKNQDTTFILTKDNNENFFKMICKKKDNSFFFDVKDVIICSGKFSTLNEFTTNIDQIEKMTNKINDFHNILKQKEEDYNFKEYPREKFVIFFEDSIKLSMNIDAGFTLFNDQYHYFKDYICDLNDNVIDFMEEIIINKNRYKDNEKMVIIDEHKNLILTKDGYVPITQHSVMESLVFLNDNVKIKEYIKEYENIEQEGNFFEWEKNKPEGTAVFLNDIIDNMDFFPTDDSQYQFPSF